MRAFRDLISVGFRNLLGNFWVPIGWGAFLCLNIRAALDSFVACALSMGLVVTASCCLPALSSPWKQCGRGERLGVALSTMAVLQVLIVSFLQQLVATGGVLRKLGLLFQWQLWPIVVVAVGGALVAAPAVGVLMAWFWRVSGLRWQRYGEGWTAPSAWGWRSSPSAWRELPHGPTASWTLRR